MNEEFFTELSAWLTEAGLAGTPETVIVSEFCDRCVAAGLPLARSLMFIDTLHPVHEGRLFRWGYNPTETPLLEYGRTSPEALAASGFNPRDVETAERWRRSPHYRMLQTGETFLATPFERLDRGRLLGVTRVARRRDDRLRRDHYSLCRGRRYR